MKCCNNGDDSETSHAARAAIVLGSAVGMSFIFLLIAGIVAKNWLPMLNLIWILFVFIAVICTNTLGGRGSMYSVGYEEGKMAWSNFGSCIFGTVLISLLGLPLTLLHSGALDHVSFGLWIGSTIVTAVGMVYFWVEREKLSQPQY